LMLGGEGEGLRMNLRSKADVDLSIRGSGHSNNVDSLNVSVAAGILCNAFLRRNQQRRKVVPVQQVARSESSSEFAENLF
jgi:21S rRNA (GM2251-2'-O)-methyltransferase